MTRSLLPLLLLLAPYIQVHASKHFPQLVVRGGLSDAIATPTQTLRPKFHIKRVDNSTTTTTSLDPDNSPEPTPDTTTVVPVFVPPTTTISGAAETTAAQSIAPVFLQIWNSRNLLNDDNTKQQYIDLVDKTKNDVTTLFNNLSDQPDPPSECSQTSLRKRSLISGITNLLKTAADVISCAKAVIDNLDSVVKNVPPDVDVVDLLTDTLKDLKTQLDDDDNDDNNSQSKSESDSSSTATTSSTSSGCTSATVTDCTVDLYESTTFYITDGSTTSSVTTSSSTNCHTITACDATATTGTTTIATTATSSAEEDVCGPSACAGGCKDKRSMPQQTQAPLPPTYPHPELDPETFFPYLASENHTFGEREVWKRDVPGPGTGDWSDFYNNLKGQGNTITMDIMSGEMGTQTAVVQASFNTGQQNIVVEGLFGCTSVVVVDHRGVFAVHIWEDSALKDVPAGTFQSDALDLVGNFLDTYAGNRFSKQAQAFLMVGSTQIVDNSGVEFDNEGNILSGYPTQAEIDTLTTQADSDKYPGRTSSLIDVVTNKIPGIAAPTVWKYRRQTRESIRDIGGGFGRLAVLYDPAQTTSPADGSDQPANTGAWQVYIQGDSVGQALWPNQEFQIWRVNLQENGGDATNVLHSGPVGTVVDPCSGGLDPPVPDSEKVEPGSPVIDIGPHAVDGDDSSESQPFKVTDANGNDFLTGCVFTGTGVYAPTADDGLEAGTMTCDGGYEVQCLRPFNNQATTCGNQPLSDCDPQNVGKNCFPYYQLLATCRV